MPKQNKQSNRVNQRGAESESENQQTDNDLQELFLDELADVYNAEQQLTKALPKMAKAAQSDELRQALEEHLEETEEHVTRLEKVAESIDETLKRKTCQAMKGLLAEGEDIVKEQKDSSALDAGIIAACQKVEHYEIASYGTLCAWAEQLGHDAALKLLRQTEEEESAADEKLSEVAEGIANQRAQAE
ncbi:MAG TPA: ferritin-like domain-containing protein [Verrucomicrobiae bacterium]|nr:ferritin-like domain-containing protein [Verrucomicrobiae bacterium]